MRRLGEIELIREYFAPLATNAGAFGLTDDAAMLHPVPAHGVVVTTDAIVAGIHFFEDDAPADVAYKALAVNVSDLAAKGATPFAYTMALALAEAPTEAFAAGLATGLKQAQDAFGISLIGGDTVTAGGAWWISITAFGAADSRGMVRRNGADVGDLIYVSGTIGDSALGLRLRKQANSLQAGSSVDDHAFLINRYLRPEPRLGLIDALCECATTSMDISDGLALDLSRLCVVSGGSASVSIPAIPLSDPAKRALAANPGLLDAILTGGDDYEVLATVPKRRSPRFETMTRAAGITMTQIGVVTSGTASVELLDGCGHPVPITALGFEHFR